MKKAADIQRYTHQKERSYTNVSLSMRKSFDNLDALPLTKYIDNKSRKSLLFDNFKLRYFYDILTERKFLYCNEDVIKFFEAIIHDENDLILLKELVEAKNGLFTLEYALSMISNNVIQINNLVIPFLNLLCKAVLTNEYKMVQYANKCFDIIFDTRGIIRSMIGAALRKDQIILKPEIVSHFSAIHNTKQILIVSSGKKIKVKDETIESFLNFINKT